MPFDLELVVEPWQIRVDLGRMALYTDHFLGRLYRMVSDP
jgi:hypothetical protein